MAKHKHSRAVRPDRSTDSGWAALSRAIAVRRAAMRFGMFFGAALLLYLVLTASIEFRNPAEADTRPVVARLVALNHAAHHHVLEPYQTYLAQATGGLLRALAYEVTTNGRTLRSDAFVVSVASGCDAIELTLLLATAILVFPASWRHKLVGLGAGALAIAALNFVRIVSLWLIGVHWPSGFDFAHFGAWPFLLTLGTLAIFVSWLRLIAPTGDSAGPGPVKTVMTGTA